MNPPPEVLTIKAEDLGRIKMWNLMAYFEEWAITHALVKYDGRVQMAAEYLGLNRTTLQMRCKKLGLRHPKTSISRKRYGIRRNPRTPEWPNDGRE